MKKFIVIITALLFMFTAIASAEITKTESIGQIEVQANGVINVHKIVTIQENGETISTKDSFVQFTPGQDVSAEDQKIQNMAATAWTEDVIAQYESDQTGTASTLDQMKAIKLKKLYVNIKHFTNYLPNGFPRYDADLKMGLMSAVMEYMAAGQPVPAGITAAKTWLTTVQGLFVAKKTAILAVEVTEPDVTGMTEEEAAAAQADALTAAKADLNRIDISEATLESQYGRAGTVLADPGVSTADLIQ